MSQVEYKLKQYEFILLIPLAFGPLFPSVRLSVQYGEQQQSDTWAISPQKTSPMGEQLPHTYKLCYSTLHKQGGIILNNLPLTPCCGNSPSQHFGVEIVHQGNAFRGNRSSRQCIPLLFFWTLPHLRYVRSTIWALIPVVGTTASYDTRLRTAIPERPAFSPIWRAITTK